MGVELDLEAEWKALESDLLKVGRHIKTGAEARVTRGTFLGRDVVIKERYPRTYRVKELDDQLRKKRVRGEARLLIEARNAGVNTPRILDLDLTRCTLILQYLPFPSLKDVLAMDSTSTSEESSHPTPSLNSSPTPLPPSTRNSSLVKEAGRLTGLLHANDIIHGDLTTSNILVDGETLWFIDFGLAEKTDEVENKGVDVHVFTEAFESTHSALMDLLDSFYKGYRKGNPNGGEDVIMRANEIAKRGRYS